MFRHLGVAAFLAGLLVTNSSLAAGLMVEEPPSADAASRAYATVFAGASLPHAQVTALDDDIPVGLTFDLDFETGYIVGGAVGTTVLPSLRGEVEFSVVKSTISDLFAEDVDVESTGYNLLGNLWYDVDTGTSFMPYIGGGVGYGYDVITNDEADGEMNTAGWLYQFGAGVRFAATEKIGLDLGYRYRVQPDADVTGDDMPAPDDYSIKSNATNHIVTAGVTVGF